MEFETHNRADEFLQKKKIKPRAKITPEKKDEFVDFFEWNEKEANTISDAELNFKPLSTGLGFHHGEKSSSVTHSPRMPKVNKGLWEKPKYFSFEDVKKKSFKDTDLETFYEPTHEEVFENIFKGNQTELLERNKEIHILSQLTAWVTDSAIVTLLTSLNIGLMFVASGIDLNLKSFDLESSVLCASLWAFWYVTYFTFAEYSNQTIGKKMMGLILKSENQSEVDLSQSLVRSFFSLFSIITLGLFSYLKGPGSASKTKVFKRV